MRGLKNATAVAVCVAGLAGGVNAATTATFFQMAADSDGLAAPAEFAFSPATGLTHAAGALGNGSATSPGFGGTITGGLPGIPMSPPGVPGTGVPNYFLLQDLSLVLTGFNAVGSATADASSIQQPLSGGTFTVLYDGGGTVAPAIVLLEGTATSAMLERTAAGSAGVLSGDVVYTGGLLAADLAGAGLLSTGTFSFGLSGLSGTFGTTVVGSDTRLSGFDADGVVTFDATIVPEPSLALGAVAMIGGLVAGRRRRA